MSIGQIKRQNGSFAFRLCQAAAMGEQERAMKIPRFEICLEDLLSAANN